MTMVHRAAAALVLLAGSMTSPVDAAEGPADPVQILELPFKVTAMRGADTEVALSVSTSGLLPIARPKPTSSDPKAAVSDMPEPSQVVVVWGEGGGAVLGLTDGALRTTLLSAEAVEGLAASESPRGAIPGSRRSLDGPLSAYLSGSTRGPRASTGYAAGLTIRERQPVDRSSDPKPVPITTETVVPGKDATFAGRIPRIATFDGKRVVLAVTSNAQAASDLVVVEKDGGGHWRITARTPPDADRANGSSTMTIAAVADFNGTGRPQIAVIRDRDGEGTLQLWSFADGVLARSGEKPGFAGPNAGDAELATTVLNEPGAASDLAIPVADRAMVAILSMKDGLVERSRTPLPAKAAYGIAGLGRGSQARLVVGLEDGRLAVVPTRQRAQP